MTFVDALHLEEGVELVMVSQVALAAFVAFRTFREARNVDLYVRAFERSANALLKVVNRVDAIEKRIAELEKTSDFAARLMDRVDAAVDAAGQPLGASAVCGPADLAAGGADWPEDGRE